MHPILSRVRELELRTTGWRRDFHAHPEMGFHEIRTAGIVSETLKTIGYEVQTGFGKTGVVGMLKGGKPGSCVMLRFDMDALPIQEETGLEFASTSPGVMHACGHDGHTAIGLTVATVLSEIRQTLPGSVKLVFQPAEEGLGGAAAMIKDGVLENPRPMAALGLHLWNDFPVGWVAATSGPFMAGSEMFRIRIVGKGGHGAMPQMSIDPILAAAQVITALQSVVARNVAPLDAAVISVTQMTGGTSTNIIPGEVMLAGTVRSYKETVRKTVWQRIHAIVEGVSSAMGCHSEVDVFESTPPVINAEWVTQIVQDAVREFGPDLHIESGFQGSASEDMALFLNEIPGCFFFIGSGVQNAEFRYGHHHPKFDFDEKALPLGAALLVQSTILTLETLK